MISSCTKLDIEISESQETTSRKLGNSIANFSVSQKAAERFVSLLNKKNKKEIASVNPIAMSSNPKDTLLYIINLKGNNGWYMISGDKRMEPILASNENGNLNPKSLNPGISIWTEDAATIVADIKKNAKLDTSSVHYDMWERVNAHSIPTEECEDLLVSIEMEVISDQTAGPLIQTKWGQKRPWNERCPINTINNDFTYVGCVAVAGAQMLYYNHSKWNKPSSFYLNATFNNATNVNYNNYRIAYTQSNLTSAQSDWEYMAKNVSENYYGKTFPVASLMAYVGYKVEMEYESDASIPKSKSTKALNPLFDEIGLNHNWGDYNVNTIKSNLENNFPVIIEAYQDRDIFHIGWINIGGWSYQNGHTWIIDGFKNQSYRYLYTYQQCPETGQFPPVLPPDDEPVFYSVVGNPTNTFYWKFNYGYDGEGDNGIYLANSDWTSPNLTLRYKKEIMYNIF